MNRFKITGYNRYADRTIILEASSQKSALTKMLKTVGIKFTNVIKLTNKVNQNYINNRIDPSTMIDFVVENIDSDNPISSIGNWHID